MTKPARLQNWRRPAPGFWWWFALAGFALWVAARLGVFSLARLVATADGERWLPTAFAGVDHPFHIARSETLLRSLLAGEIPRWIGHHQGGYPVEFYPLGVPWLEVGVWGIGLGLLPMPQVHTIVIAVIFVLPGIAFALMANLDGWTPRVALVALALHVLIPGNWWHGGYTELVQWGLVSNVGGTVAALFCLAWLSRYVWRGDRWAAAGAVLAAAAAVYTNPRSLIALAVVGAGVWLAAASRRDGEPPDRRRATRRISLVGLLAMLVAAPELLSLARFSDLYQFVRYERYVDARDYLDSALAAVSLPALLAAAAGGVLAVLSLRHFAARATAISLSLYCLVTLLVTSEVGSSLARLEATRLMPFQRLLTVYLAAVAIELATRFITAQLKRSGSLVADVAMVVLVLGLIVGRVSPASSAVPVPGQTDPLTTAFYPVERGAVPEFADFEQAIALAAGTAAPGTGLLVIGSALSWHQRLWAPLWTDRPFQYDNWLWYWHDSHVGTPGYVWAQGNHYPDPEQTLDPTYLMRHGIGAVVVTGPAATAAAAAPWLEQRRSGLYFVFRIFDPVTLVTFAGNNAAALAPDGSGLIATGMSDGGTATIRRNWYPRWRATVNDQPVPLTRTDDGYMSAPIPAGDVTLRLTYQTDGLDWVGRILCLLGLAGAGTVVVGWRRQATPAAAIVATTWRRGSD
ncbi:MAG: YfhO family protein [Chloroflexota bacterium]|nr:YfhO family protein [Chloroflexota bacterium]